MQPGIDPKSPSVLIDDSGHNFDVSVTTELNSSQMNDLLTYITSYNSTYNLNTNNCTDFAIGAAGQCGLDLPDSYGSWPFGGGSNPGDLGQDIRALLYEDVNSEGGKAEVNSGSCE